MILPAERKVVHHVRAALTAVSKLEWNNITADGIASEIAKELKNDPSISSNVWCYSGKRRKCPDGCDGPEFRFDFCALLYETRDADFPVQAAVIGETEWDLKEEQTDFDFEKLLLVDSIVCFLVCGAKSVEEAKTKVSRYERAVGTRNQYAKMRESHPSKFILACYVEPQLRTTPPADLIFREV